MPARLADPKGIEPSIFSVTGRRVNRYTTGPNVLADCNTRPLSCQAYFTRKYTFGIFPLLSVMANADFFMTDCVSRLVIFTS